MTSDIQHPQAQAPAFASFEIPKGLHPNTATLVRDFAEAMAKKLRASEIKYGWTSNWMRKDWRDELAVELLRHVHKGDPIDVATYAAFAWFHGWSVAPVAASATYGGQVATVIPYADEDDGPDHEMDEWRMLTIGRPGDVPEHVLDRIPAGAALVISQHSEAQVMEIARLTAKLDACILVKGRAFACATKAEAALAALSGWKLVPITPTQGMLMAGADRPQPDPADPRDHEWGGMYRAIYGAMLEASPPADRVVTALAQIDRALGRDNAAANPLRRIDYPEGRFGPAMLDGGDEMTGRELQLIAKSHGFDLRLVVTEWDDEAAEILDRNGTFGEALEAEEPPQSIVGGYQLVGAWEGEEDGLVLVYAWRLRADANPEGTAAPGASS
jgi:hypothetical protein